MKKLWIMVLTLGLFAWISPSTALAAKADGPKAKFFAKYDKNHNGVIDEDEKEAIRKDYAASPDGELKKFDKNKDGKLDDEEIAAIKPPAGKKKGDKTEKAGKAGKAGEKTAKASEEAGTAAKSADKTSKPETTDKPIKPGDSSKNP
jgi:hypothetical protein